MISQEKTFNVYFKPKKKFHVQVLKRIIIIFISQYFLTIEMKNIHVALNKVDPKFISPVENQTAAIGREATFSCSVSNIGKYKVGWLRASDKMIISLHTRTVIPNERIIVKYFFHEENVEMNNSQNGTWKLIIRQLKETDRGCYMCQINTDPMISQVGCLDILVSPDILSNETSTDLSVVEGDNATLLCKASGKPKPKILWKREDGSPILLRTISSSNSHYHTISAYNGSILSFQRVDRKQMGTYLCIASNDVHPAVSKRVTLSVNFLPNVQALNQLLGAPEGTDVILECNVEAHPNAVNYWFKNPNKMLLEGSKYVVEEKRTGYKVYMRLTIKNFHTEDSGSYSCISSNSLGRVEGISRLYNIGGTDRSDVLKQIDHISMSAGLAESFPTSDADCIKKWKFFQYYGLYSFVKLLLVT